jgi:hypothetical protein
LPVALQLGGSPVIFGYAKPVPVTFANLRNVRKGTIWVAAAGVVTNMILAVISAVLFQMILAAEAFWTETQLALPAGIFLQLLRYSVIICQSSGSEVQLSKVHRLESCRNKSPYALRRMRVTIIIK